MIGAPELVIEIAASSASKDLHIKKRAYRRNQIWEYIVWRVLEDRLDWFILRDGRYLRLKPAADGYLKSEQFPGLWLDPAAAIRRDLATVLRVLQQGLASPEHAAFVARLTETAAKLATPAQGASPLNDDDIKFGDVSYREPQMARRPDLDPRLACMAYRLPGHEDMPIFLEKKPADAIERHSLRDTSVELGGILLGKECLDETTGKPFVWITEALEAKHYENTQASFTYTHDSWGEITRELDEKHPDLDIVGWYHTHPDFGIFLSSHDLFIHHNFFDQPLQVAYVVDPIRQDRGFFHWRDGRMVQTGGFFLAAARSERASLARLVNDLEGIPTADGGGGGVSGPFSPNWRRS